MHTNIYCVMLSQLFICLFRYCVCEDQNFFIFSLYICVKKNFICVVCRYLIDIANSIILRAVLCFVHVGCSFYCLIIRLKSRRFWRAQCSTRRKYYFMRIPCKLSSRAIVYKEHFVSNFYISLRLRTYNYSLPTYTYYTPCIIKSTCSFWRLTMHTIIPTTPSFAWMTCPVNKQPEASYSC